MDLYKKIAGWYFFLGGIVSAVFYFFMQSGSHLFSFLIPNLITAIVLAAYIFISGKYILKPAKYETAFQLMLIVQSIQFHLKGYTFKNFYFPELSFHIDLGNEGHRLFTFSPFTIRHYNGYFQDDASMVLSINLLLLGFLLVHSIITKRSKSLHVEAL